MGNNLIDDVDVRNRNVLMIGPSIDSMGGISTVVNGYIDAGLFHRWSIVYLETHVEGSKLSKLSVALKALLKMIILLLKRDVALVHVHSAQGVSFWRKSVYILVAFIARCPVIFHLHGCEFMQFYNDRCGKLAKKFVCLILEKSSYVISLSSQWKRNILQIAKNANVVCVYNSVLVPPVRPLTPQKKRSPVLLFLGRLGKRKGIYDLLDAVATVKSKIPNVKLKCGGDGELTQVSAKAEDLGILDNVDILGWVRGNDKQILLDEASIYVLPSYDEGLPMGILEAMSNGLPVVASTVGGIPDAIDTGIDGVLIEPGDLDALVSSIETLLLNAELRGKMGNAARNKIKIKFSADKILPQIEDLYRSIGAVSPAEND